MVQDLPGLVVLNLRLKKHILNLEIKYKRFYMNENLFKNVFMSRLSLNPEVTLKGRTIILGE